MQRKKQKILKNRIFQYSDMVNRVVEPGFECGSPIWEASMLTTTLSTISIVTHNRGLITSIDILIYTQQCCKTKRKLGVYGRVEFLNIYDTSGIL